MRRDISYYSMENGYRTTQELLKQGTHCTAIFAISDLLAIGACRALWDAGKRVPKDFSVAGFDGIELGQYYMPSLTTIRQPADVMAKETVTLLFEIIAGRKNHQHLVYDAELLERESTAKNE